MFRLGSGLFGFGTFVKGGCIRIWRSRAALAWSKDEFLRGGSVGMGKEHVAVGTVEQLCQNLCEGGWSILSEDTLVGDAACDLECCSAGDLTENLVEAGVVCRDGKGVVRVGDLSALWRFLRREQRKIWRCGGWCCGEGRCDLNGTAVGLGARGRLCCQQSGERKAGDDEESDWRGALHVGVGRAMTKEVIRRQGVLTRPVYRELVNAGGCLVG